MSFTKTLTGMLGVCFAATATHAAVVTVTLEGTFDVIFDPNDPAATVGPLGIQLGDTFTTTISYDTDDTPIFTPDAFNAAYDPNSIISFETVVSTGSGDITIATDTNNQLNLKNDEPDFSGDPLDVFAANATRSADGISLDLLLSGTFGPLTSLALPSDLGTVGDWNTQRSFSVSTAFVFPVFPVVAQGTITSIRTVPAPITAAVLPLALTVASRRRR